MPVAGEEEPTPAADPDRDGYSNLLEYLFATQANAATPPGFVTITRDPQGDMSLTFQVSKNVTAISYSAEQSVDLHTWSRVTSPASLVSEHSAHTVMRVTVPSSGSKTFLRLSVSGS